MTEIKTIVITMILLISMAGCASDPPVIEETKDVILQEETSAPVVEFTTGTVLIKGNFDNLKEDFYLIHLINTENGNNSEYLVLERENDWVGEIILLSGLYDVAVFSYGDSVGDEIILEHPYMIPVEENKTVSVSLQISEENFKQQEESSSESKEDNTDLYLPSPQRAY